MNLLKFFLCALLFHSFACAHVNLEDRVQDFVLETKKIELPEFPYAFNPSIIRFQGRLLMSFRNIPNSKASFYCRIGLVFLNEDFSLSSKPQLLDTQGGSFFPSRAEDARLIVVNDSLYIVYSDNKDEKVSKGGFRVYIAKVNVQGDLFSLEDIECFPIFKGESKDRREKNWVPFEYEGTLLLAYSIFPHRILRPIFGTGMCEDVFLTYPSIAWDFGELRGGTAALIDGDKYISFFHSSKRMETIHSDGKNIMHYFMGAYTFSCRPPFEIQAISEEPIVGKNFYEGEVYKPYWNPLRVVFPCGFVMDEHYIWIAYGRQDHECWIVKLDKEKLLCSLIPVHSLNTSQ